MAVKRSLVARRREGARGRALVLALLAALVAAGLPPGRLVAQANVTWAPPGWSPGGAVAGAAGPALVATRAIPSRTVLSETDVALRPSPFGPGLTDPAAVVGQETRSALYAGRPIRAEDIGPPALVERNALVTMRYVRGSLVITAEGRALDRGAAGERVRVANLASRQTVRGVVAPDGVVEVRP